MKFNLNNVDIPGLVYLASPYTKHPKGRQVAFQQVANVTALMLEYGIVAFSPITYSHPLSPYMSPRDSDEEHMFWMDVDRGFMRRCDALVVLQLEGWEDSKGVTEELAFFRWARKPVYFLNHPTLFITKETEA